MARVITLQEGDDGFIESFQHLHPEYTPVEMAGGALVFLPYDFRLERGSVDDDFVIAHAFGPRMMRPSITAPR